MERTGKELIVASKEFASEQRWLSWFHLWSTLIILIGVFILAASPLPLYICIPASILTGLVMVRMFIVYHDFMHGAILRKSRLGKMLFHIYGFFVLTPPRSWRHSHNFHHANVGKPIPTKKGEISLLTSDIGAVPLMTTDMWKKASFWRRLRYRISRHPLTILGAYLTVFMYSITLIPFIQNPRKFWDGALSMILHGGVIAVLWILGGFQVAFFVVILPFAIAAAAGAYLFFAQHNYEGAHILPADEWSHFRAALESSSYLKLGPVMNWFTGNIGYHHVHHLNSRIPYYRLPEAMAAIPELQSPVVTTLRPKDILNCFRLSLWDTERQRLVAYQ